jgi:large subunit ribosomal protein L27
VRAGANVGTGTDHTLFAKIAGKVLFQKKGAEQRLYVSVLPEGEAATTH